jgi:hypothetical protein
MSRKKKQNPIGALILYILALLLLVFTVVATLFIWIGWLVSERSCSQHPKAPEEDDVQLQPEEEQELAQAQSHIRQIEARLASIEAEGSHLRRRRDGLFHAGSALGAQLNAEIGQLLHDLSDRQALCHELQSLPEERLRDWAAPLTRLLAFRWAIATYVICAAYALASKPASALFIQDLLLQITNDYLPATQLPLYGSLALASIVASCCGAAAYWLYSRMLYNHYAEQLPLP